MAQRVSIFDIPDYKEYLALRLPTTGERRGMRGQLAAKLGCNAAHVSQVLNGAVHFSLEHAALIDEFLEHEPLEGEAFLLAVHIARAGNIALAKSYRRRFKELASQRQTARIGPNNAPSGSEANLAAYYSHWHVAAVHVVLMSVPLSEAGLAKRLRIGTGCCKSALEILVRLKLVERKVGGLFRALPARWHLPASSPLVPQHHRNWRVRSMMALDECEASSLHYSGVVAVSETSARKIRELLVNAIEEVEAQVAQPGDECPVALALDCFRL